MRKYAGVFVRGVVGLAVAALVAGPGLATAGTGERAGGGQSLLLAQKTQPELEKPKPQPAPAPAPEAAPMRRAAPPRQLDRGKSMKVDEDLERAGTRKLGGEVIRNKDE